MIFQATITTAVVLSMINAGATAGQVIGLGALVWLAMVMEG